HISYRDSTNQDLKYAACSSSCTSASSWTNSTIDPVGNVGSRTSIAIDSNDAVHISYHDITNGDLKYATDQSGSWANTTVDSVGTVGQYTSIAIDSNDVVHISYYDATNKDLKYASNMQSSIVSGVGGVIKFVDRDTKVGNEGTSIAVDSSGDVHISYYDGTNGDLKYATLEGAHPWNMYAYSISPSLPAGLSLNAFTGEISGTPTELSTNKTYTITAWNTGGSNTTTITIEVLDQLPGISYSPQNLTLTNNTVSTDLPLIPNVSGSGAITSWELNNTTLPAGISFGASNGTFYGTPTELWTRSAYMVWANNSGGSAVAYLNITVNDQLPAVSYSASVLILTNNTASTDLPHVPVISGAGLITSWEINNTNLPSGLAFGINNGTIYGIPTQLWPETQYKIWGNNSGGTTLSEVTITVNDQLPTLAYNPHNITLTNNTVSPDLPLVPAVNGSGIITSWELNDTSLPSGISFGSNNGTIYGVATQLWPNTAYKVWANNTGGSVEFYFNLTVIDQVPTLGYNPITLTLTNNTISSNLPLSPTITGSGVITSWELEDTALPNGISFGASNGTFYGVPTQLWPTKTYTVWANNSGGAIPATITITVNDQLPNNISYNPESITLVNNTVSSDLPLSPSINGPGFITSWELNNTSLPSGISFGTNNGTIYGIATQLWPTTAYKVWANNSGGSTVAYLNITVIDQLPTISYSPADVVLTNNTISTDLPLAPTIIGPGEIVSWEFNGTLPSGINFGNNNGTFWGIPTKLLNQTQYIVWANNTGGSSVAYVNITVVDQLPTLSYIPENLTLLNNTQSPSLPIGPTLTGAGIILEWGITDGLPDGLSFGNDNGTIWGIPTERMNKTMFTIWANNTGGSVTANINITVLHQMPMFNYSVLDLVLVNNTVMTNVTSAVTGGEIVSWEVSPDMPDGINLDGEGNISGLPIIVQDRTMYMIWANNSGGSHVVYLNITIYDIIATLDYIPENLTLTRNVTMSDLLPTYTGIVDSWAIYPDLPDGLNFTNGTISGTPEKNMTRSTYTVYANNTGGSISHTINITVLEPMMEFDYIPYNVTLINNTASTDMPMVPILYNDGVAETWEIWPTLPDGLNFSSSNGTISGIATKLQIAPVNYTVWANNSGGVASAIISITIIDQLPNLSYPRDLDLMNNTDSADLPMTPILDGVGVIVNWDIWPEIPEGLNFSNENGSITGIATELLTKTQFTVWANNSGGSSMAIFNITIVDQVPNDIGYNHLNLVLTKNENNSDILPLTPNLVGAGNITSWDINGTLPDGLNFSNANGTIWGIPTELFFEWQYFTIYANNSGGSVNSTIAIIINDQIPTISYNISDVVFKNDTKISSIEATIGGGPFTTLAIHPDLPDGMYFDYDNATIWGLPTELTSKIEYKIWANNSGGSTAATIFMTIEENEPLFEYMGNDLTFYANKEMAELPLTVISLGGEIQNFSITPQLPEGLFFGELNGTIWGIATEDSEDTAFTITAYNAIGDYSYNVNLVVYDYLYEFELDPVWIGNDTFMPAITPTYIIPGATYSISPSLPEGMSVNPYTGVVSGRPNGTKLLTSYTLTASVDGYTLNVPMELGILEDTDSDGMPDQIPPGGNALGIIEDTDDDNDNVDDMTEMDCDTDPLDADDKPKFNSNGNCAPEPQGIGFLWCLPLILLLLLLIALIISTKKKDEVDVVAAVTKPSEKKKGREKWMQDYRIDDDEVEWGEDKEGNWWRRAKREVEWTEWDRES
ncbi:MAG: hypothetical protein CL997_06070, partial [Euryarchaeota archaeon]|nr:hypothetical protein [Euryarchaeota archaeon]